MMQQQKITYHWTSAALASKHFSAVDQLNRTNWGNPNTGSMLSCKNFFVIGSGTKYALNELKKMKTYVQYLLLTNIKENAVNPW